MNIRPNRIKQKLAAGEVATILSGANNADMIDQLGHARRRRHLARRRARRRRLRRLSDLTRACDLWGVTSVCA